MSEERSDKFRSRFQSRIRRPFPQEQDSNIQRFGRAFEASYDEIGEALVNATESHFLSADDALVLDLLGARYGTLGRRRGRGNQEYRRFLKSIIPTFQGRGTTDGIAFAVAAGVGADSVSDVDIPEYPESNEYSLRVYSWAYHSGTDIRYLANLADPSGVELREPVEYQTEAHTLGFEDGIVEVELTPPSDDLGFRDSTVEVVAHEFDRFDGSDVFDGEDNFDPAE